MHHIHDNCMTIHSNLENKKSFRQTHCLLHRWWAVFVDMTLNRFPAVHVTFNSHSRSWAMTPCERSYMISFTLVCYSNYMSTMYHICDAARCSFKIASYSHPLLFNMSAMTNLSQFCHSIWFEETTGSEKNYWYVNVWHRSWIWQTNGRMDRMIIGLCRVCTQSWHMAKK